MEKFTINEDINKDLIKVKFKDLLIKVNNTNSPRIKDLKNGQYNFYTNNKLPFKNDTYNFDDDITYLLKDYLGEEIRILKEKFNYEKRMYLFKNNKYNINLKYLYYLIKINKLNQNFINGIGVPNFKSLPFLNSYVYIHKDNNYIDKIIDYIYNNLKEEEEEKLNNIQKYLNNL